MEFNSLFFIMLYLPIFIGLMFFIHDNKTRNFLILISSLLFYALGNIKNIGLIITVSILSYIVGKNVKNNKNLLIGYLIVILSFLSFFKYGNYFIDSINSFIKYKTIETIIMPLGISFYVFTSISYVVDCYKEKIEADNNYLNVLTFTTFFPVVVSGPLLRYESFKKYLDNKEINTDTIANGLRLFIIGLAKKVIIANQLNSICTVVFASDTTLSFPLAWYGALSYTLQIYFDFSGYSDMAIGIAKMIGFEIPINFNYPYISTSIQDFWRRWHISLSTWFKDYVYIPLGGNRVNTSRWIINTLVVWTLTGMWHGSTFNFLLWGLYNGVLLIIYRFIFKDKKINSFISWATTMLLVVIGWTIFNTNSINHLLQFIKAMIGLGSPINMAYIKSLNILKLLPYFFLGFIGMFPFIGKVLNNIQKKSSVIYDIYLILILILSIVFIVSGSYSAFIYFGF